jgi:hypothetical protein
MDVKKVAMRQKYMFYTTVSFVEGEVGPNL